MQAKTSPRFSQLLLVLVTYLPTYLPRRSYADPAAHASFFGGALSGVGAGTMGP
jgi:hypothetical protein